MAKNINFDQSLSKAEQYAMLYPQIRELVSKEEDLIANSANIVAVLKQCFGFFWVGVYFADSEYELVLGPFQGPVACTRIKKGRGVCGTAWEQKQTIIVPDVEQFPGHIACSSLSKSEIVVPVFDQDNNVLMVIDVDSEELNTFDDTDREWLERIAGLITEKI